MRQKYDKKFRAGLKRPIEFYTVTHHQVIYTKITKMHKHDQLIGLWEESLKSVIVILENMLILFCSVKFSSFSLQVFFANHLPGLGVHFGASIIFTVCSV